VDGDKAPCGQLYRGLSKVTSSYCPEGLSDWQFTNGTLWKNALSLVSTCATIQETCCTCVNVSTTRKEEDGKASKHTSLGVYTAVGTSNGRYLYQMPGKDRFLEYEDDGTDWLITNEHGSDRGFIYHNGGSICPEHTSSKWKIFDSDLDDWNLDPELSVECVMNKSRTETEAKIRLKHKDKSIDKQSIEEELEDERKSRELSVDSSPLIARLEPIDSKSGAVLGLSLFSALLLLLLLLLLARRGYRAWTKGAKGVMLLKQTVDL